jgi:ribonuclease VapC
MIVDSSVIVAVLCKQDDYQIWTERLYAAVPTLKMSAATYLETCIVIDGRGDATASANLDRFLELLRVEIMPVTPQQATLGRSAYARFGKGSGHAAKLNYGDCFSYALAIDSDAPLMFKGDDFGHTDVRSDG